MDLSLNEQQRQLQDVARDFVRREAPKDLLVEMDRQGATFSRDLWQRVAGLGWLGMAIPAEYGGDDLPLLDIAVVFEELGRGPVPGPFLDSAVLCARLILAAGSEDQKKQLLPRIATGERIFTLAAMDGHPGWGPGQVRMVATANADGYELSGTKPFALYASVSDTFIVAARTPAAGAQDGVTLFVVDATQPGVRARELQEKKLEGLISGMGELTLDQVRVPASAVLGEPGQGWRYLQQAEEFAIPTMAAYQVGGMAALSEMAIEYSQTRVVFGQPIGRFQRVQDQLIDGVNNLDAARWINYETIWKIESGQPATADLHMVKAVASEGYYDSSDITAGVFGGIGVEPGTGVNKHIKMSRRLYAHLGDPVYHRDQMVEALAV